MKKRKMSIVTMLCSMISMNSNAVHRQYSQINHINIDYKFYFKTPQQGFFKLL